MRPADYRRELARAAGFHDTEAFVLRRQLRLDITAFTGLALSSSHAAGVIERFGIDGARSALSGLATPHRVDEDDVLFGYVFQCFTARRYASPPSFPGRDSLEATSCLPTSAPADTGLTDHDA